MPRRVGPISTRETETASLSRGRTPCRFHKNTAFLPMQTARSVLKRDASNFDDYMLAATFLLFAALVVL